MFCLLFHAFHIKQIKFFVRFLGESTARQSCFQFYLTFSTQYFQFFTMLQIFNEIPIPQFATLGQVKTRFISVFGFNYMYIHFKLLKKFKFKSIRKSRIKKKSEYRDSKQLRRKVCKYLTRLSHLYKNGSNRSLKDHFCDYFCISK